jgi:toxin-antitoxin system PIN domain toxin
VDLPDVNILVYAFRDDVPQHPACKTWLDQTVAGDARFAISKLALGAVVRIATSPRIFPTPSGRDEVFDFCRSLIDQPHSVLVEPGERHWNIFQRLCDEANITGPRTTDAWYAALAVEQGCEWISLDRDFARFPGLRWRRP